MDWRTKVELFAQIRWEYEFGVDTIKGVARKLGVHRRMVREALKNALPSKRGDLYVRDPSSDRSRPSSMTSCRLIGRHAASNAIPPIGSTSGSGERIPRTRLPSRR